MYFTTKLIKMIQIQYPNQKKNLHKGQSQRLIKIFKNINSTVSNWRKKKHEDQTLKDTWLFLLRLLRRWLKQLNKDYLEIDLLLDCIVRKTSISIMLNFEWKLTPLYCINYAAKYIASRLQFVRWMEDNPNIVNQNNKKKNIFRFDSHRFYSSVCLKHLGCNLLPIHKMI